jgi:hypothetical protein
MIIQGQSYFNNAFIKELKDYFLFKFKNGELVFTCDSGEQLVFKEIDRLWLLLGNRLDLSVFENKIHELKRVKLGYRRDIVEHVVRCTELYKSASTDIAQLFYLDSCIWLVDMVQYCIDMGAQIGLNVICDMIGKGENDEKFILCKQVVESFWAVG